MIWTEKNNFFEGWYWFKFNNLELELSANLKFYSKLAKGVKLKLQKNCGLIPMFVEVTGEKLAGGSLFAALKLSNCVLCQWFHAIKVAYFTTSFSTIWNLEASGWVDR